MLYRYALAAVLLVNACQLLPELSISQVDLNDNVLHFTLVDGIKEALEQGRNPFDFWSPEIAMGMPIARLYQPFSHMIVVAVYFLLFKTVDLMTVFVWVRFLALVLMPLTFYAFCRLIRLSTGVGLAAAILCQLASGDSFGIDLGAYVWYGHGLFPQLVATHFLLLTLGTGWRSMREPSGWFRLENWKRAWIIPGILLAATGWSNLLYGYVAAVSLIVIAAIPDAEDGLKRRRASWKRLAGIASIGLLAAIPRLFAWWSDSKYFPVSSPWNHGREFMWNSFGATTVLKNLATGEIFDHGRLPVLTLLVVAGIVIVARKREDPEYFALGGFLLWIVLYFGRPFWGAALYLVGIVPSMPLHRLIGPVQIFGVILAAIALDWIFRSVPGSFYCGNVRVAATMFLLVLPVQDRIAYLNQNAERGRASLDAYQRERADLENALQVARAKGGRVYAGLPGGWGSNFKVGDVPVYSFFPTRQLPSIGFLYLGFFLGNDNTYRFNEWREGDYRDFNVRTVIAPIEQHLPWFLTRQATFGRFVVYAAPGQPGYFAMPEGTLASQLDNATWYDAALPTSIEWSVTFHPNWKAKVDGQPVKTAPNASGFTRIQAPQGVHTLTMHYR